MLLCTGTAKFFRYPASRIGSENKDGMVHQHMHTHHFVLLGWLSYYYDVLWSRR